jgi:hypothetical protein
LKQQELIDRLRDELTHVVAQTEGNAAMGLTDHNKIAENLICGLMREILGFRGLRNLNASEHANYPAIDLPDFGARIAVQVNTRFPNARPGWSSSLGIVSARQRMPASAPLLAKASKRRKPATSKQQSIQPAAPQMDVSRAD